MSQSFQSIWLGIGPLLRLVGVMNIKLMLSRPFNIPGREPYLCDFVNNNNKRFNIGWYSDFTDRFL